MFMLPGLELKYQIAKAKSLPSNSRTAGISLLCNGTCTLAPKATLLTRMTGHPLYWMSSAMELRFGEICSALPRCSADPSTHSPVPSPHIRRHNSGLEYCLRGIQRIPWPRLGKEALSLLLKGLKGSLPTSPAECCF